MKRIILFLLVTCIRVIVADQKHLVAVVPSYNNAQWYRKNLDSIYSQQYENYSVIYIDDCSDDGTCDLVNTYLESNGYHDRTILLRNEQREGGSLPNIYRAVHMCRNDDIILVIDGDDWLKHDQVFARINDIYQDEHILLTYGQCEQYPKGHTKYKPYPDGVIQKNVFREYDWLGSHLRTFYAGLFKQIALKDFLRNGQFFKVTGDLAFMIPMLELAGKHSYACKEILYVYNEDTPLNDFKWRVVDQLHCDKLIRSRPKYQALKDSAIVKKEVDISTQADVVIISENPLFLDHVLQDVTQKVVGVHRTYVVYNYSDEVMREAYGVVKKRFPDVVFLKNQSVKGGLSSCLSVARDQILLLHDRMCITKEIDIASGIKCLVQTKALGFYYALGLNIHGSRYFSRDIEQPPLVVIHDCYAWQFEFAEAEWRNPLNALCSLYNTQDLIRYIEHMNGLTYDELMAACSHMRYDVHDVGLCGTESHAICLQDLPCDDGMLHQFIAGKKYALIIEDGIQNECVHHACSLQ